MPTFYGGRICIDFSDSSIYHESFNKLLRWIYEKPLETPPPLGPRPLFVDEPERIDTGTSSLARRAEGFARNLSPATDGALREYFDGLSHNLEAFRLAFTNSESDDDLILHSVESMVHVRDEYLSVIGASCINAVPSDRVEIIHDFFEKLINYFYPPNGAGGWPEYYTDNYKFFIHEIFLFTIANFIKYRRFESAALLLETPYYVSNIHLNGTNKMFGYRIFRQYLSSFERLGARENPRPYSLQARTLKGRVAGTGFEFLDLMQVDFLLMLRADIKGLNEGINRQNWYPLTLVYCPEYHCFEIFAKSISKRYFEGVATLLGITGKDELSTICMEYRNRQGLLPQWGFHRLNPPELIGLDSIATIP